MIMESEEAAFSLSEPQVNPLDDGGAVHGEKAGNLPWLSTLIPPQDALDAGQELGIEIAGVP